MAADARSGKYWQVIRGVGGREQVMRWQVLMEVASWSELTDAAWISLDVAREYRRWSAIV